jgi:hypothetical protein
MRVSAWGFLLAQFIYCMPSGWEGKNPEAHRNSTNIYFVARGIQPEECQAQPETLYQHSREHHITQ